MDFLGIFFPHLAVIAFLLLILGARGKKAIKNGKDS
jgi:hypothetical protein